MLAQVAVRRRSVTALVAAAMVAVLMAGLEARPAEAAVTAVKGYACGYITNVGLFGGPQSRKGCAPQSTGPPSPGGPSSLSPSVTLPVGGSAAAITASDPDGAEGEYGPASIFGGRWPESLATAPPSGPISVSTQGTVAGGTVTSTARIALDTLPAHETPNDGPGGFGPAPVDGDELNVSCTATETSVTGTTTFVNAELATATDAEGSPIVFEDVPNNPPVNYTRHGVITNVGDVFTVVYNEQIVNADGSLTVNAAHMYLYGPTAVGEVIKGQVTCGTTPSPLSLTDTVAPTCGTPVVEPIGPEDPTPKSPRTELVGVFDARGLQSITNVQATNATVQVGKPGELAYRQFVPGQTGPLAVTATAVNDSLPMVWSFDATDAAGNVTRCEGIIRPPAPAVSFPPLTPARILDSRPPPNQVGPFGSPWRQGLTRDVAVAGVGGVPAGAVAVVLNVTVTGTTAAGFLTIWPAGQPRPLASSLNWSPGQTIPNAVTVRVGAGGKVSVLNPVGSAQVIFDVVGYYDTLAGDGFTSLTPARILDSRPLPNQVGPFNTPWAANQTREVQVAGVGGVAAGADAVVLNVTVTGTTGAGYLTIWPSGQLQPVASSLNWSPGQTIPNAVTVKVGALGRISVFNAVGQANVIIDVVGSFAPGTGVPFHPLTPSRILDSRPPPNQVGPFGTPWGPNVARNVQVTGAAVPGTATAALLNVTATSTTAASFLTVWPAGQTEPVASSLNWGPGDTIANSVTAKLSATGAISIRNFAGNLNVIADVAGWYG